MIPLPTGCRIAYEIRFYVSDIADEMVNWFNLIGGSATTIKWYNHLGQEQFKNQVQYGKAKPSYVTQDGTRLILVRFTQEDVAIASIFLIKFFDYIQSHNLKETET